MVRHQLSRLRDILARHSIELTMVFLPEYPLSRERYNPEFYANYRRLITEELPNAQFIDLWDRLPAQQFYDLIHTAYPGSRMATEEVIRELTDLPGDIRNQPPAARISNS